MIPPLPPLNAMRAFEAAARHASMSRAAHELNVTPAAVSHQVKGLEEFLGVKLFRRRRRGLEPTDAGAAYCAGLGDGFRRIAEATEKVRAAETGGPLTLSTTPTFAAKWLVHRLARFSAEQPDIQVLLSASTLSVAFDESEADMAVRYGPGGYPGFRADKLFEEEVFPVCSPALLDGADGIHEPRDLLRHTLLHSTHPEYDETYPTWEMWLMGCGVEVEGRVPGPRISPHWVMVEAAVEGQGVALAKSTAVEADLAKGRLVRLFGKGVHVAHAYWLVGPRDTSRRPKLAAFREWILREARNTPAVPPGTDETGHSVS